MEGCKCDTGGGGGGGGDKEDVANYRPVLVLPVIV